MINVDAAVFEAENRMGIGLVFRNHKGDFLATVRQGIDKIINPELVETLAVSRAVLFASQFQYSQVVVVSDCLSLISKLKSNIVDRSHARTIVEDKKMSCVSSCVFLFCHVSVICNQVAHALARSSD
jgi:hypothetical protein